MRQLFVAIPGDIDTRTGGYGYDRKIVDGLRQRGWQVEVLSLPGEYPCPSSTDRVSAARALAQIPDGALVLADGLAFGALPDEVARERQRLRLIALVHHPLSLETGLDAATASSLDASERRALACARGIVVTSAGTVRAVEPLAPGTPIVVVEPGTDAAALAAGSESGALHLLCVASIIPRKGHDTLVEALSALKSAEWRLVCAGSLQRDAAFAARVVESCARSGIDDRVDFPGELEGEQLEAAYREADLFVLPTRYEGYGMAVAEAIARGIPVVSTATGAIADLVPPDAGVLVPTDSPGALADALRGLIADRTALGRLRAGVRRKRLALPTWASAAAQMEAALLRLSDR